MTDDMELVRQYAADGSESAFATIVSRHANLVYSAALRLVGDPHAAEEVSQAVFIMLSEKADSLNKKTILPGWLYRATCYAARSAKKREYRRLIREQEAYMQSTLDENQSQAGWEQMAPLLEEAMLRLSQNDRDALVLRYFEGRSLSEVGAALGVSEDATKKRVNRALEKLRKSFAKHGVVTTTVLIAGVLSTNSVQAAPCALAHAITAVGIAKGAAASISSITLAKGGLKLMAWAKMKTAIVVGLGLVLTAGSISVSLPFLKKHGIDPESKVQVKATVKMKDGSNFPPYIMKDGGKLEFYVNGVFRTMWAEGGYSSYDQTSRDGSFTNIVDRRDLFFSAWTEDLAPAVIGPINLRDKTSASLEVALEPGFSTFVHVVNADTGAAINNAAVTLEFKNKWGKAECRICSREATTDRTGLGELKHCSELLATITVTQPGYETTTKRIESLKGGETIEIPFKQALVTRGTVFDKRTGKPIPGATFSPQYEVWGAYTRITQTDSAGRFRLDQLPRDTATTFCVKADGYAGAILRDVRAGQTNLEVNLGPEMPVQVTITGDLHTLTNHHIQVWVDLSDFSSCATSIPLQFDGPTARFAFTNPVPGKIRFAVGGEEFTRFITNAIDNWEIRVTNQISARKTRPVRIHFDFMPGASAKGTVYAYVCDTPGNRVRKEILIQDDEATVKGVIGQTLAYEPAQMVGGWFEEGWVEVPPGEDAYVTHVQVFPASSIFGEFQNRDGSQAKDIQMTHFEVALSPYDTNRNRMRFHSPNILPKSAFKVTPLPLNGSYQIVGRRGTEICSSQPILLTEKNPNPKIILQFGPTRIFTGQVFDPNNHPLTNSSIIVGWAAVEAVQNTGYSLATVSTDAKGQFQFDVTDPAPCVYKLTVSSPGMRSQYVTADLDNLPMTIRLEPGLKLTGRLVDEKSGEPLKHVRIQAQPQISAPWAEATTDENGNFQFDSMEDTSYWLFIDGHPGVGGHQFKPSEDPVLIKVGQ